ncbi:MAG: MFS transporter [Thermoprotei archaeon]|nr:MFS transporter [Thermoprotei archaeon]
MKEASRNLGMLFVINITIAMCFNMGVALLPLYLNELGASVPEIAFTMFLAGLTSTILMIVSGAISNVLGFRIVIAMSLLMLALSGPPLAMCKRWEEAMIWISMLIGSMGAFLPPRMLLIAEFSSPSKMGAIYGAMNISWPLGGLIGPLLGGLIADVFGWKWVFYLVSITATACIPLSLMLNNGNYQRGTRKGSQNKRNLGGLLPNLMLYALAHILISLARGMLDPILPIYLQEKFNSSKTQIGAFFSVGFGLSTMIVQVPSGLIGDKYGHKRAMLAFASLTPLLSIAWPHVNDLLLLTLLGMCVNGLYSGTWSPSITYIIKMTPRNARNLAVVLRQTCIRLGFTIGPIVAGWLWDTFGPVITFYGSAAFFAAALVLMVPLTNDKSETPR